MRFPSTLAATSLLLAMAGSAEAFQQPRHPSSISHGSTIAAPPNHPCAPPSRPTSTSTTTTALQSATVDDKTNAIGEQYDYDELMESEMERARLTNQYAHYSHKDWLRHRASDRFFRNLFQFDQSPIVKNLLDEAAVLALICAALIGWNELLVDGYTDFNEVHHAPPLADALPSFLTFKLVLPTDPFFLCGGPLGLLLVFRNDCSYSRYKEAFHHVEVAMSSLSNMQLMASNASKNVEGVRAMGVASWALFRTLQHEVSGAFDPAAQYEADLRGGVPDPRQVDRLLGARSKLYRAQWDVHRAVDIFSGEVTNLDKRTIVNNLNTVATACAECERLYATPIPLLYTRHALKFLTFWMTFLPFAFYGVFESSWNHVLMIPAICIICFLFFGIEEIAVSLEEPFSILPMDEMVEELQMNIEDTMEWMEADAADTRKESGGIKEKLLRR